MLLNKYSENIASEGNNQAFIFNKLLNEASFIELVRVVEVQGEMLTVISLLNGSTLTGDRIENQPIYGVPIVRLQCGNSAIIMDPKVGDIGLLAVCDNDISTVKSTKNNAIPPTKRTHSRADGIYITGIASLNNAPTQIIQFNDGGITIHSSGEVNINGLKILADGRLQLVNGVIVDSHVHGGVQSGGSQTQPPN